MAGVPQVVVPDIAGAFLQGQKDAQTRQINAQTLQENDQKLQAQQRKAEQEQAAARVMQESGGDWEVALPRLRSLSPDLAVTYEKHLSAERTARAAAMKQENDLERAQTERALAMLRVIRERKDPALYASMRGPLAQIAPDLDGFLPEQFDPNALDQIMTVGETAVQAHDRRQKAIDHFLKGDFHAGAAMALSTAQDAEDWDEAKAAAREYGVPKAVVDSFGAWTPDAPRRALQLGMTPNTRADNTRQQAAHDLNVAQFGETQRHHRETEAQARRRVALGERRAAQGAAGSSRSGGDGDVAVMADAVMAGDASVLSGLTPTLAGKVRAEVLRRGGKLPAGADGKPSTGQEKTALAFFNRARQADNDLRTMEGEIQSMGVGGQIRMQAGTYSGPGSSFTNWMQSQTGQAYTQAQRAFTEARLRKDSGAAIPDTEFENDRRTYFAQPGDSAATLEQKRRARAAMLASMGFQSGRALREFYGDDATTMIDDYRGQSARPGAAQPAAPAGGKVRVTAPDGRTFEFPTQAAADAFKKKAGVR